MFCRSLFITMHLLLKLKFTETYTILSLFIYTYVICLLLHLFIQFICIVHYNLQFTIFNVKTKWNIRRGHPNLIFQYIFKGFFKEILILKSSKKENMQYTVVRYDQVSVVCIENR